MKTRVVHLINSMAPGGAERLLLDMAPHWDSERFDVRIIYLLPDDALRTELEQCPTPVETAGMRGWSDWRAARRLQRRLAELEPDVLHTHLMLADCLGRRWAVQHHIRAAVTTLHSGAAAFLGRGDFWGRAAGWLYCEVLERTRRVQTVACSGQVAESFRATGLSLGEIVVVENGIDLTRVRDVEPDARTTTRAALGIGESEIVCLTVARLGPEKGHAALLAAAEQLGPSCPIRFLLVGGGELRGELEARVRAARLGDRVTLLGHRDDVPELLRAADLFALPSRWEGRPLALMEAYAAGLPIVATDVGGVRDMVLPGRGILVPADDVDALADAIRELGCGAKRSLDESADDRERRFDVRICVRRYEELYDRLLGLPAGA